MSAIMIGVGGVGGTIVADVRRQLGRVTNKHNNSTAARQRADQYRFFLVDTKEEPFGRDFRPNERFVVPSGLDKFYVDEKITSWHASDGRGDEFFELWWPVQNHVPYRVGDFDEGAGQIRIKGKLGYRIHIGQGKSTVVDAVDEAVRSIRNARGLGANRDLHKIPVYIVSSLGGGTGSGIVLTLAKHLRRTLPTYCVLQGVFLLGSIAALAPSKSDEASIWANTDAALREIDYFQRPLAFRLDQPTPYLEWPGAGNRIPNREEPFHYIYLFTRGNRVALNLDSLEAYTRLVSECLVAENFGEMSELIKGPHSQFVARFVETPDIDERPTCYASVGLAGVRYPSDRILQHLSRRFGAAVIKKAFSYDTLNPARVDESAARNFLQGRGDFWDGDGGLAIQQDLLAAISDERPTPQPWQLTDDEDFFAAPTEELKSIVSDRLRLFETWRSQELIPFLIDKTNAREQEMLRDDKPQRSLRWFLASQLGDRAGGVSRAMSALAALLKLVKQQQEAVNKAIGERDPNNPQIVIEGFSKTVEQNRQSIVAGEGLDDKSGLPLRRSNKTAKQAFARTWEEFVNASVNYAVARQALTYYLALENELESTQEYLKELILAAKAQGDFLQRSADDDLGANIKDSELNVGILDNVKIVDHHFSGLMEEAIAVSGDALVKSLITGERGLAYSLQLKVDRRAGIKHELVFDDFREAILKAVLDEGRRRFQKTIEGITIWDAIKYECIARKEIGEPDEDFDTAKAALEHHREDMARNGTPLVNSDIYLLEQYIQVKLARLKNQAQPFWQLDQKEISEYADRPGLLYPVTVLAFDRASYDDFASREGLDPDLLAAIGQSVGVPPQHLDGPKGITLYWREGVAPLFFLNREEKEMLRTSAARIRGRNKEIYTDIRLEQVVDPIIAPPKRPEERRKYALGVLLEQDTIDGRPVLTWTRPKKHPDGTPEVHVFATVTEAVERLAEDPDLLNHLYSDVALTFGPLSDRAQLDVLSKAIERAKTFRTSRTDETKWWQQAINIMEDRLNTAQFRV